LQAYWDGPVSTFAEISVEPFENAQKERHRMYSLLLMTLVLQQWNGNKYGETGDYALWRAEQQLGTTPSGSKVYLGGSYQGHNIAALAVDGEGRVIDYDFNHNNVFDSSAEHAESRLVRRLFALNQVYAPWSLTADGDGCDQHAARARQRRSLFATAASPQAEADAEAIVKGYSTLLTDVTIYTSLESCAQCSGIMTLGSVKEIVYLQWDQGEFLIGNIMFNATAGGRSSFRAPRPVAASEFDFDYFTRLNDGNAAFERDVNASPFYVDGSFRVASPSVTSFLCTDGARQIYTDAAQELAQWSEAGFPEYVPPQSIASALTNSQVLREVHDFAVYAKEINNRGTPHRV
jgi:tRNA(Arg) A34 adenosine deaminase TadA